MFAQTPEPPYYAVIFSSIRTEVDKGYAAMADAMHKLAQEQPGFLGMESARNELGIAVSYWRDPESIQNWKENTRHQLAQQQGKASWYKHYKVRIAKVERDYGV